ncbi:MAG TPA: nucleotidyltransferase family protein [Pyrinomonadaceae bacterium]|nr:nucleotidyltransferase family protein [Pyrinomonadaceae bacterium]
MKLRGQKTRGHLVSSILTGSWRDSDFPPLELSELQLDEVTPLLYGSGAGALGWWRLRSSHLGKTASTELLHQAYRLLTLQSAIHEEKIAKVFKLLRESSIEPILIKGRAAAELYPDRALRPYGDIDLLVRPSQFQVALEILAQPGAKDCWVDLHKDLDELDDRSLDKLFERSRLLSVKGEKIRVLSLEDHLALLAIHLLKHGAWRPLWLCDVGAAIESLPADFDWSVCLGENSKRVGWIKTAISLSQNLLGARVENLPSDIPVLLPTWLVESVLRHWEQPFAINQPPMSHPLPIFTALRKPGMFVEALRQRWPNPILATTSVNGKFNNVPRLPYQLGNCLIRTGRLLLNLPRVFSSRKGSLSHG